MYETPPEIAEQQGKLRDTVPSLGLGFKKATLDSKLHARLMDSLRQNVHKFRSEPGAGFIHSENPRAYPSIIHTDPELNEWLLEELREVHEEWSGMRLKKAVCYGIRVYQPRSYLYVHIDRAQSHVVSSTICVDSRVNTPWPLYVEDEDGKGSEIALDPGEMAFFEGARLKHGRPHPLDGDYYANIFVHYTPVDWKLSG